MRVLFICTGNTCRSPMAQGLAKRYFPEEVEVFSAGIQAIDGDKVSKNAVSILNEKSIDISQHQAVKLTRDMIASADHVFTMTRSQERLLSAAYPEFADKIQCLGDIGPDRKEIPDPWGGSIAVYRACAQDIEEKLLRLSSELKMRR